MRRIVQSTVCAMSTLSICNMSHSSSVSKQLNRQYFDHPVAIIDQGFVPHIVVPQYSTVFTVPDMIVV